MTNKKKFLLYFIVIFIISILIVLFLSNHESFFTIYKTPKNNDNSLEPITIMQDKKSLITGDNINPVTIESGANLTGEIEIPVITEISIDIPVEDNNASYDANTGTLNMEDQESVIPQVSIYEKSNDNSSINNIQLEVQTENEQIQTISQEINNPPKDSIKAYLDSIAELPKSLTINNIIDPNNIKLISIQTKSPLSDIIVLLDKGYDLSKKSGTGYVVKISATSISKPQLQYRIGKGLDNNCKNLYLEYNHLLEGLFFSNIYCNQPYINSNIIYSVLVDTNNNSFSQVPFEQIKSHNVFEGDEGLGYKTLNYFNTNKGFYYLSTNPLTITKDNSLTINQLDEIFQSKSQICMLDLCIDKTKPVYFSGGRDIIIQYPHGPLEIDGKITSDKIIFYNMKLNTIGLEVAQYGGSKLFTIKKYNNYYLKQIYDKSCAGQDYKQFVYDLDGNYLSIDNDYLQLPKSFKIGQFEYKLLSLNYDYVTTNFSNNLSVHSKQIDSLYSKITTIGNTIELFFSDLGYGGEYKITNGPINGNPTSIYGGFNNYKYNYLLISGYNNQGNITDLQITKKLLGQYFSDGKIGIAKSNDNSYEKLIDNNLINKSDLPLFNIKSLGINGISLLSLVDGYSVVSTVEMCKPAVYVYDDKNTDNWITLNVGKYLGLYTHLDPAFNIKNGWSFKSKDGKVIVENNVYDYLYYALKVPNYKLNSQGYIVKGEDVLYFFNDKLNKLKFKDNEKKDFIEFWKDKYSPDKYYMISFKYNQQLDKYIGFNFKHKPSTINRIIMESIQIKLDGKEFLYDKQNNSKFDSMFLINIQRDPLYDVFEWGGVYIDDKNYIIY